MTAAAPTPRPGCAACDGAGYTVRAVGLVARAASCPCIPTCSRCGGAGTLVLDGRAGRCRCQMLPDRIHVFNLAGIPARHAASSFSTYQLRPGNQQALQQARDWVARYDSARPGRGLVLWGKVGRGKTHLLCALLRALIFERGVRARFVEFSRLLAQIKEGFDRGEGESTLLTDLASAPVLAVDEMGKGRLTDWEQQVADELITRRYNSTGLLLGTTNYRPGPADSRHGAGAALRKDDLEKQTLGDRVGDRAFSRLEEMVRFAEVDGEDWRRRGP